MTSIQIAMLAAFMAAILLGALYGLTIAGHFPAEHRNAALRVGSGRWVLWGSIVVTASAVATALVLATLHLPWAAAVIGGGAMLLAAPLLLQPLPDRFVDAPPALLIFAAGTALSAFTLGRLAS